jgi:hypothetical protein
MDPPSDPIETTPTAPSPVEMEITPDRSQTPPLIQSVLMSPEVLHASENMCELEDLIAQVRLMRLIDADFVVA